MEKYWIIKARELLALSREPIPHELNELDWKSELSSKQDRTIEHLIAFANHPGGGYLVFGVRDGDAALIASPYTQVPS
ncbi:MAG: hypothetical protein BWK73_51065 [Thiothrix lacustris]|uniref:Schlafen AlbA-2 domain-containing protein n=1 Tax=Thiothrix lacustris TaxID=525917 RepID=A0A1Y1Q8D2_9GAMM|nr:MAG: hypothetical protein BWK73_51065 [Thiothrix lacustris]